MMLLLEECLSCYGAVAVFYIKKMKLNLQLSVCIQKAEFICAYCNDPLVIYCLLTVGFR